MAAVDAWSSFRPAASISNAASIKTLSAVHNYAKRGHDGLDRIRWNNTDLVPANKYFWTDHPNVAYRDRAESEKIRLEHTIYCTTTDGTVVPKPIDVFDELPFPDWCLEALKARGITELMPIQIQGWPVALHGYDLCGVAETGSGKTLGYLIPMLIHISAQEEVRLGEGPIALILQPCRELCTQVAKEIESFQDYFPVKVAAVYGGESTCFQRAQLHRPTHVIVATPARLLYLLSEGATNLKRATYVVVDEADLMAEPLYVEDVNRIMSEVRPDRQVLMFSATWSGPIELWSKELCIKNAVHINVGDVKLSACKNIIQDFWCVGVTKPGLNKMATLVEAVRPLLGTTDRPGMLNKGARCLVFCNSPEGVGRVVNGLREAGQACEGFYGNLSQRQREDILRLFAEDEGKLLVLVATQVLGRGHDFKNVKFVINYDMPYALPEYIHRVGRTGRDGKKGFALTMFEDADFWHSKGLVECLQQTKQNIPPWLQSCTTQRGRQKLRQKLRALGVDENTGESESAAKENAAKENAASMDQDTASKEPLASKDSCAPPKAPPPVQLPPVDPNLIPMKKPPAPPFPPPGAHLPRPAPCGPMQCSGLAASVAALSCAAAPHGGVPCTGSAAAAPKPVVHRPDGPGHSHVQQQCVGTLGKPKPPPPPGPPPLGAAAAAALRQVPYAAVVDVAAQQVPCNYTTAQNHTLPC